MLRGYCRSESNVHDHNLNQQPSINQQHNEVDLQTKAKLVCCILGILIYVICSALSLHDPQEIITIPMSATLSGVCAKVSTLALATADIEISGTEESLGNISPWTVQHLGCGEKGLVVKISEGFFAPTEDVLLHHRKGMSKSKIH